MKGGLFTNERIQNIGVFFTERDNGTDLQKLLKLYYFSDRGAYLATGLTMSGLDYAVREKGPVPEELAGAIGGWLPDTYSMGEVIHYDRERMVVSLRRGVLFNEGFFSKRELKILEKTKQDYAGMTAEQLSDASHREGLPWSQIWDDGKGEGLLLNFDLDREIDPVKRKMIEYVQSSVKKFQRSASLL